MYVYIYIYTYGTVAGGGDRVSSKNRPVRGPPKSRFRDHAFSHYKNMQFRGKVWSRQKRLKIINCTPHGPRGQFCRNTHLNLCTEQLGAKPLRQGAALIKIVLFEVHVVQGLFACSLLSASCKILCSYLLECLFL